MTANDTTPDARENVTVAQIYDGDADDGTAVPFVQLKGDGKPQSTFMGDGASVEVAVDDDGVTLTVSADFENAERLLDRDILSVTVAGKDLGE